MCVLSLGIFQDGVKAVYIYILPHLTSVPWLLLTEGSYTSGHEFMVVALQVPVIPSIVQNHTISSTIPLLLSIILGVG